MSMNGNLWQTIRYSGEKPGRPGASVWQRNMTRKNCFTSQSLLSLAYEIRRIELLENVLEKACQVLIFQTGLQLGLK